MINICSNGVYLKNFQFFPIKKLKKLKIFDKIFIEQVKIEILEGLIY